MNQLKTSGLFHFFYGSALVVVDKVYGNVWAHLSAEHTTDLRPGEVTYEQVVASPNLKIVFSVGFMSPVPEPKNRQILVGPPLAAGKCEWESVVQRWRIDCPVNTIPPNDTDALWQLAKEMITAVLAPSFGCRDDDVSVILTKIRPPYFDPDGL